MSKTKTKAEAPDKAKSRPTLQKQAEPAEKKFGPSQVAQTTTAPLPPPNGKPSAARAADLMMASEPGSGAAGRARLMRAMQGGVGNARLSRMLSSTVQAKLTVGAPNDVYEQEADRIADRVIRMPEPGPAGQAPLSQEEAEGVPERPNLQDKEAIQTKPLVPQITRFVQRQSTSEEEVTPQTASDELESSLAATKGGGNALPEATRSSMESAFRADFSGVKVHTNSSAVQMNRQLGARAFTQRSDIYFNAGQYQPNTSPGQHLLAHELTHTVQQGGVGEQVVQRAIPDDKKISGAIDKQKAHELNKVYWDRYKLETIKPLRDLTPSEQPDAYANRTLEAQRLLRASGQGTALIALIGKELVRDGILGPRTLLVLRLVAVKPELAKLRFEIAGLGFDLEAIASDKAYFGALITAMVEIYKPSFIAQWTIETKGELVLDNLTIGNEATSRQWYDDILFEGRVPVHLDNKDFTIDDRHAALRRAYAGVTFQGVAGLVEVQRNFLDQKLDNQTLISRDKARGKRTKWVSYKAESKSGLEKWERVFGLTFPESSKVTRAREEIETQEKWQNQGILTGLLFSFYIPELTKAERLRLRAEVEKYLTNKKESAESFVQPRADQLISLLEDEDIRTYDIHIAYRLRDLLYDFLGQPKLFEALIAYLQGHKTGDYFEALIEHAEKMRVIPPLELLVSLLLNSQYANHPGAKRVIDRLSMLKQRYQPHEYVVGDKPGVKLNKDDDKFLAVGEVAGGVYRKKEDRQVLKEEPRARLEKELEAQVNARLEEIFATEGENPYAGLSDKEFTELALKAAAEKVGITEDSFKEVSYEESLRLKGVRSEIINGVEEYFVDFEVVGRIDGGKWDVVEESKGFRPESEFGDRLFWYYFGNLRKAIETIVMVEMIVLGGFVALSSGAMGFLVALAGGKTVVGLSIALSVLIYAITNRKHLTVKGFLMAVLEGYLNALLFRGFSPVGAKVASLVGTTTFKQKLIGLSLRTLVVGGGTGAISSPAMLFVEDVLRGKLRSPEAYLRAMAVGMLIGIVAEFVGTGVIAPIFRTAGRNVLEKIANIEQLKAFIKGAGIKDPPTPSQWSAEMTGGLSRFRAWLFANLDSDVASKVFAKAKEQTRRFIDSYLTGLELTVHRQALELAEIELEREAVDGLERLIRTTAGKMDRDAVSDILNQLAKRSPKKANAFLMLINKADNDLMDQLIKRNGLKDLATSDGILTVAQGRPAQEITNLLSLRFKGAVNDFEDYARGLMTQSTEAQERILNLLNTRGSAVTPESLLRITQAGVKLSDEVVGGLSRMVRASEADLPGLEAFLRQVPEDKMDAFLRLMQVAPADQFEDLLKLVKDPARANRLLRYTDDPADLYRMMQTSGQKLDDLDKLFQATSTRTPAEIESLLGRNAGDAKKVRRLVEQVAGDVALLERTIVRLGSQANVEKIFAKAAAEPVTTGQSGPMRRLLQIAEVKLQNDADVLVKFIEKIHLSQGSQVPTSFGKAVSDLKLLIDHHPGTMFPFKSGSKTVIRGSKEITLSSGAKLNIDITDERLYHFGKGHLLDSFSFTNKNLERPSSTFWPPNTTPDMVLDRALRALDDPQVKTLLDTHTSGFKSITINIDGFDCRVGIDIAKKQVAQFFPEGAAGGAIPMSNDILAGIKKWFGL